MLIVEAPPWPSKSKPRYSPSDGGLLRQDGVRLDLFDLSLRPMLKIVAFCIVILQKWCGWDRRSWPFWCVRVQDLREGIYMDWLFTGRIMCCFIWVGRRLRSGEKGKEWNVKTYGMGFGADGSESVWQCKDWKNWPMKMTWRKGIGNQFKEWVPGNLTTSTFYFIILAIIFCRKLSYAENLILDSYSLTGSKTS